MSTLPPFFRRVSSPGPCISFVLALFASLAGATADAQSPSPVTFNKDIAPLLWSACANCHRPGESAPFSLITYDDVRPRAADIIRVTKNRAMPPWKPEPGHGDFQGVRRLTEAQLALLASWADSGFLRGPAGDLPPAPQWKDGWQMGDPDLVVAMPEPYILGSTGHDLFRTFVIPIPLANRRYVKALELKPGRSGAVHHANIKIDPTRLSQRLDDEEPTPGYEGGGSRKAVFPDGHFLGWTPGQSPRVSPDGMAWRLDPGSDLVIEAHLMPGARPEPVQLSVALYFTDEAPTRTPYIIRIGRQDIDIKPGEQAVNADSFTLPVDVDVLGVQPHAHYLAREVRGFAKLPDGSSKDLILIKDWDFHWQDMYRFSEPLFLPKGTTISMRFTYDNSSANARNPNHPPRRITYGQTTASEMGSLWIQVVPRNQQDLQILDEQFAPKLLSDDIAGYEKILEVNPGDARAHAALAYGYVEAGRPSAALVHFEKAAGLDPTAYREYALASFFLDGPSGRLEAQHDREKAAAHFAAAARLKPDFGEALYGLAITRHQEGRLDEAIELYRRALALNLRSADAHYNLGRALVSLGNTTDAIAAYRQALDLAPADADAHAALAAALASVNQVQEAITHYRRALQIAPDLAGASTDLAWILATSDRAEIRNPEDAVALAEHAVALTKSENAAALDTLAAAYAAAGQMPRAISSARLALKLALESGETGFAAHIRERLDFYITR